MIQHIDRKKVGHEVRVLPGDRPAARSESPAVRGTTKKKSLNVGGQPVLTVEELSKTLHVSTKTISRWRQQGLVSCRFVSDGRKRIGFLESSVKKFVHDNPKRVRRGAQFSQLTDAERDQIISRARRLAAAGGCPADVTKRLARKTGRSVETIRYTLKQYDRDHLSQAIFPDHHGPMREETKQRIFEEHRKGRSVETLAKQFCHTRTSIRRIVSEMRAKRILELPLDHVPNEMFARVSSERAILGRTPVSDQPLRKARLPKGLPPYLASLYEIPLLTREQEMHLFRKMNYLKYKAGTLVEQLDPQRPKARLMDQIERLYDEAVATKNEIIRANLRLVVSIAKRHVSPTESFFDLVSDGNISLMRAAEKFDFARGNKFSTYASWAIMKNFARTIPDEHRRRDRFRTSHAEMFVTTEDMRSDQKEQEATQAQCEFQVGRLLKYLEEREQSIIIRRFGLNRGQNPLTLKEVGAVMGVTKERIRQIEARAMNKLRKAAKEEHLEIPGIA
ncbi:MAG TPA: sigma-70 family RNA polymerase sigma factor [Thermoguttaceae bacterium]|nr:sigma-70 family RNA polymerase sigma factor [Thermoguttaceae bacterium]